MTVNISRKEEQTIEYLKKIFSVSSDLELLQKLLQCKINILEKFIPSGQTEDETTINKKRGQV